MCAKLEEKPAKKLNLRGEVSDEKFKTAIKAYFAINKIRLIISVAFLIIGLIMCLCDNTPNVHIGSIVSGEAKVYDVVCNVGELMVIGGILLGVTTDFDVKYRK